MRHVALLSLLLVLPRALPAQGVLVAPHYVVLDHRTRSGALTLYNPGNEPVEITIGTLFGYPVTDSAGEFTLYTSDAPDSTQPSATGWIEAFPRRLTLGPKEQQIVRLLGRPPASLRDGEYWTRLVVTATGGHIPVTGIEDTTKIQVGLNLEVRTILPVFYRKGALQTGVAIRGVRTAVVQDSLEVRVQLEREGNAAFLGTLRGALVDSTGATLTRFSSPIAVYVGMEPRFTAPLPEGLAGTYRLRLELASEREDLTPEIILASPPASDTVDVRLP